MPTDDSGKRPRVLILAPTRELAIQIQATIDTLGRDLQLFATTVVGGADMQAQVRGLRQRPDIIVATPGRLLDHMWNGTISLLAMNILVLDEADRMLDMGFAQQINQILDAMPEERQTLLFSATMPMDLARLAQASVKSRRSRCASWWRSQQRRPRASPRLCITQRMIGKMRS